MPQNNIEHLNRLCRQLPRNKNDTEEHQPISLSDMIAHNPVCILLGEPGMGKTSALEALAENSAGQYITANDFLLESASNLDAEKWYFIDALDEARLNAQNAFQELRKLIKQAKLQHFCIACRSADWFSTDANDIQSIAPNTPVAAFELLPLDEPQACQLLQNEGIQNPQVFLEQANTLGFADMLGNPQSLRLLAQAVNSNQQKFPSSRRDAYELACTAQLTEQNPRHAQNSNTANTENLLDAAGWLCALLLLSNRSHIQDPKTVSHHDSGNMTLNDVLGLTPAHTFSQAEIEYVYKTRLFCKPDGYAPIHRTIAEYLAARYLSKRIQAGLLPTRLAALILADETHLIANLRGLAGWLASLCETMRGAIFTADPAAILDYGDLHLFSQSDKAQLIQSLAQHASFQFNKSYAPLVDETMRPFVAQWLHEQTSLNPRQQTSSQQTTTDLLLSAISTLKPSHNEWTPTLLSIVRNEHQPNHTRRMALDGLKTHATDHIDHQKNLINDIQQGNLLDPDLGLAGVILHNLYPTHIQPSQVLTYFDLLIKGEKTIGSYRMFWQYDLPKATTDEHLLDLMKAIEIESALTHGKFEPDEYGNYTHHQRHDNIGALILRAIQTIGAAQPIARLAQWLAWCHNPHNTPFGLSKQEEHQQLEQWQIDHPELLKKAIAHRLRTLNEYYSAEDIVTSFAAQPAHMGQFWLKQADALRQETQTPEHKERAQHCLSLAYSRIEQHPNTAGISFEQIETLALSDEYLKAKWYQLTIEPLENNWRRKKWQLEQAQNLRNQSTAEKQQRDLDFLLNHLDDIRQGKLAAYLHTAAWAEMPYYLNDQENEWISTLLKQQTELQNATLSGYISILQKLTVTNIQQALKAHQNKQALYIELPALLGAANLYHQNPHSFLSLDDEILQTLLMFLFLNHQALPEWFFELAAQKTKQVEQIWWQVIQHSLRSELGDSSEMRIPHVWQLGNEPRLRHLAANLLPKTLSSWPVKFTKKNIPAFADVLMGAIRICPQDLPQIILNRLDKKSIGTVQRAYLIMAGMWVAPQAFQARLADLFNQPLSAREPYLGFMAYACQYGRYREFLPNAHWTVEALAWLFRLFAPLCTPTFSSGVHIMEPAENGRDFLMQAGEQFLDDIHAEGLNTLQDLLHEPQLAAWHNYLKTKYTRYAQALAERQYTIPTPAQIAKVLCNSTPANHADLMALAMDALAEMQTHIINSEFNLIHRFWNTDPSGKKPIRSRKAEPECRNVIAEWLHSHLHQQKINVSVEQQHGAQNQSDISLSVHTAGGQMQLPIEVKGDWHRELWTAPETQLAQKYSTNPQCKNTGIYLVLWTGEKTIKTLEGAIMPNPQALQEALQTKANQLPNFNIRVKVLDISINNPQKINQ